MGNRYSGVGGSRHAGRDPGDDLERNPGRDEGLGLLATATEDEWIASLEANDAAAGSGALDHQLLDFTPGGSRATPAAFRRRRARHRVGHATGPRTGSAGRGERRRRRRSARRRGP